MLATIARTATAYEANGFPCELYIAGELAFLDTIVVVDVYAGPGRWVVEQNALRSLAAGDVVCAIYRCNGTYWVVESGDATHATRSTREVLGALIDATEARTRAARAA